MTAVVLCGKRNDPVVCDPLLKALSHYGGALYFNGRTLKSVQDPGTDTPRFVVYDCEEIPDLNLEKGILLFKNSFCGSSARSIPAGVLTVFESYNGRAAGALKGTGVVAITCGTSAKDTLSVASLDEMSATVSLQRTVKDLSGTVLEPRDVAVELDSLLSPYQLLAVCSVLLLSGEDPNSGYRIF